MGIFLIVLDPVVVALGRIFWRFFPKSNESKSMVSSMGSGCGLVGRAVTSKTKGRQFESSRQRIFIRNI